MSAAPPLLEKFATREEWLAARRTGVGGSDIAAILGKSPWRSPIQIWASKVGLDEVTKDKDDKEPIRLRLGNELEPVVAKVLAEESGLVVERTPFTIARDPDRPTLICSPDGFAKSKDGDPVLVELKTADSSKAEEWEEGVPEDYVMQVNHNLGVTGLGMAFVGCLIGGTRDFRWAVVERDEGMIETLRDRALAFWEFVRTEQSPPPTGHEGDTKALNARFPRPEPGKVIALPAEMLELTWDLQRLSAQQKELEEEIERKRNEVRVAMADAEEGILPGDSGKWTWKTQSRKEYVVAATEFRVLRAPRMKK